MGSACGKSNEPTANVINNSGNDTNIPKSDINIPGILHLINEGPENNKVIDKDIFQAFISKHPHGPEAYWSNPKDFAEPFDSTTFFQAYSKDATAGPSAQLILIDIVKNSQAADSNWGKTGMDVPSDDWSEEFQDEASAFFGETYASLFGMGMIDTHESLMQYWSSSGALDKTIEKCFAKSLTYNFDDLLKETRDRTPLGQWILNLEYDGEQTVGNVITNT
eukprot:g12890.t1